MTSRPIVEAVTSPQSTSSSPPAASRTEAPQPRDPRKGLLGVGAGLLVLESFTVMFAMLAVFGMSNTDGNVDDTSLQILAGVAVALFVGGFLVRRPWGRRLGSILQLAVLGLGVAVHSLLFVALLFVPMWVVYLRMWGNLLAELGERHGVLDL